MTHTKDKLQQITKTHQKTQTRLHTAKTRLHTPQNNDKTTQNRDLDTHTKALGTPKQKDETARCRVR